MDNSPAPWRSGHSSAPLPPLVELRPLVATNVAALVGQLSAFFLEYYVTYGPIYRYRRGAEEHVVIAGQEANLFMARAGRRHLRAEEYRREQNEELGVRKTLVSVDGEEHRCMRVLHQPGYARSALDSRYPELLAATEAFARKWRPGERLLVQDFMPRIIGEQLGLGVVNYPLGERYDDLAFFVRTLVTETVARTRPPSVIASEAYRAAKHRVMQLADEVTAAHRSDSQSGRCPDLVDHLLAALGSDPTSMTPQELRVHVLGGYIGGLDTVANTCSFLLYSLLQDEEILARVQSEVDAAFVRGPLTPATLKEMETLHHATLETLRLYPVSPAVRGTVGEPFEFAGHRVETGQNLTVGTTVPHLLPSVFSEPFLFDIDRFGASRSEHRKPGAFAPFGVGPHVCLGAGMAEVFIMLTLASLLRTVRLELDPPDYRMTIRAMPAPTPVDFHVRVLEHRNTSNSRMPPTA